MTRPVAITRTEHTAAELRQMADSSHDGAQLPLGRGRLAAADGARQPARLCYLFGAICPDRAVGAAVIMPAGNAEAINEHLKKISVRTAPGANAALVCNRVGWHQTGEKLIVRNNITLRPLPTYSPELNPMENVWQYLRQNKLCARVWDSYEAIVTVCVMAWDFLINDPACIRSLGGRDWAQVNV